MMPDQQNAHLPTSITGEKMVSVIRRRRAKRRIAALTGGLAMALLVSFWGTSYHESSQQNSSVPLVTHINAIDAYGRSLEWLSKEQLPTGAWDVEKWEGKSQFKVGVSAMATIAIMTLDQHSNHHALNKALNFLMQQQNEDGSFGPRFLGDLYNQSLGTLALRLAQERGFNVPSVALAKAQLFLQNYRVSPGQWAYRKGLTPEKNLSAWANLAMGEKPSDDQPNVELNVSQSSTFLTSNVPLDPQGKSSLPPMDVFLKTNTKKYTPSLWERELLTQQIHQGDLAGSWPVEGPWGHVGGRVFTTSIALLSLTKT